MLPKKQILIVEDNELNRDILCEILSQQYSVLEAENGLQALDILKQHGEEISLVFLDIQMPVMDGYTFLDIVKKDEKFSLIPIIVMTQNDNEDDEVTALSRGATDYVPKPYRAGVILQRAANLISLRENAAIVNAFRFDRLTGLYRHDFFCKKVSEILLNNPDKDYSIICSNIEHYKLFNDMFGVRAGNDLIKEFADIFRSLMGNEAICSRYREDRFMALVERNDVYRKQVEEGKDGRYCNNFSNNNVVIKWGIYEITDRTIAVEHMCDRASLAVDRIKGQYNKFFSVYDDELRNNLLKEKAIMDALTTALEEEQFTVYLQPKYSLKDERLIGAEALVRWIHPEWGMIPPGDFIPLCEKNGFISTLDKYIWERVCNILKELEIQGYKDLPISVNVSRINLYHTDVIDTLLSLTQKYGVDPSDLHLEITESAYADPNRVISMVKQLRSAGFLIELDDFGSGYSSLNILSLMKPDVVKLDMKFVWNETAKSSEKSILEDIIRAAHRMHLSVVAEGVENRSQVNRLLSCGCDCVQGYYFAKPMPVSEYTELLKKQYFPKEAPVSFQKRNTYSDNCGLLVVDENDRYREQISKFFEAEYSVFEASDTQNAIDCLRNQGSDGLSAIILSTTLENNGFDTILNVLRSEPKFWHIPVLSLVPSGNSIEAFPTAMTTDDFLCRCHPLKDVHRRIERAIEMSDFRKREEVLKDEANRDYLTGLLNRRGLESAFSSLGEKDLPLAVVLFDVDNLKKINDTLGHDKGDLIIKQFAEVIRSQTRTDDIQCRYGGDEFLVILKHLPDKAAAFNKAQTICRMFSENIKNSELRSGSSCGIAWCDVDETPSSLLIERADLALYRAKNNEKGSCLIWE